MKNNQTVKKALQEVQPQAGKKDLDRVKLLKLRRRAIQAVCEPSEVGDFARYQALSTACNIVLIGMSGAGKSTLGVLLAKALAMDFIDTDILLQQKTGKRLQEIIDESGVDGFLRQEEKTVAALKTENCVIATGGSVVYSAAAMANLKQNGEIIYISVTFEELQRRLTNITTRGIVMRPGESLKTLFEERLPLYEKYADITVSCTATDIETAVAKIIAALPKA